MYEIDSKIPAPLKSTRKYLRYPFGQLKVGQSFFVPLSSEELPEKLRNKLSGAAGNYSRRRNYRITFTISSVEENGVKGFRCWRTN